MAAQAPVVLVFVDLHWADQGLLDFVEDLLAWARTSPIFVVALARPELLERRPDWGSGVRSVTRINLEPLAEAEMRSCWRGMVPGLPRAGGPRDRRARRGDPALRGRDGAHAARPRLARRRRTTTTCLAGDLSELAVAETLQALIAARLDALARGPAAAAGRGGPGAELHPRRRWPPSAARRRRSSTDALDAPGPAPAADARRRPTLAGARAVSVRAGLVREVAYQSLAKPDRRARHLAAARYFERLGEDELAGVLANHYLDAYGRRVRDEADALAAQARIALRAAAERATALHAPAGARLPGAGARRDDDPPSRRCSRARGRLPTKAARMPSAANMLEARRIHTAQGDRFGVLRSRSRGAGDPG